MFNVMPVDRVETRKSVRVCVSLQKSSGHHVFLVSSLNDLYFFKIRLTSEATQDIFAFAFD